MMQELIKTPKPRRNQQFHQKVVDFNAGLEETFDCGGKEVMSKKENVESKELIQDQVYKNVYLHSQN
jgi:hypothetical protein